MKKATKRMLELMAPVSSFESLQAAINSGADSIYFGIGSLNMRSHAAKKLGYDDLPKIKSICSKHNIKCYLTINSVLYNEDLDEMKKLCKAAKKAAIDAVIVTDIAAMVYAKKLGLRIHASTQLNISNTAALKFFSKYIDVAILARELSLGQIKEIAEDIKKEGIKSPSGKHVRLEAFVHGALCVAIAGKCYMSLAQYASSANRGKCLHACRRAYKVIDEETGDELKLENKYVMSPKDLCCISIIDKLIDAGITIFKIEGRGRSPDYVSAVVKAYREAIDSVLNKSYTKEKIKAWEKELRKVFNRGFWMNGYYLGKRLGEWHDSYGSKSTHIKQYAGKVINYFQKAKAAEIKLEASGLCLDNEIVIIGPTTGTVRHKIKSIMLDNKKLKKAEKGQKITISMPYKLRKNDKLYIVKKRSKKSLL